MTLRRTFVFISAGALISIFLAGSVLTYLAVRDSIQTSQEDVEKTLTVSMTALLTEPLRLGSFVEARNRIFRFQEAGGFVCAEMNFQDNPISKCDRDTSSLRSFELSIPVFDSSEIQNPKLKLFLDKNRNRESALRKGMQVGGYLFLFGTLIALVLLFVSQGLYRQLDSILSFQSIDPNSKPNSIKIQEFKELREKLIQLVRLQESDARLRAYSEIAQQVAHDIRSPLAALRVAAQQFQSDPEECQTLINQASVRINSMAEDLLSKNHSTNVIQAQENQSIRVSIQNIVREKRALFPNIEILIHGDEKEPHFSQIEPFNFERSLANLLQNSCEAIRKTDRKGLIEIKVEKARNQIVITISDNGSGIPEAIRSHLGQKGVTSGKSGSESGHGIGFFAAKNFFESSQGLLEILASNAQGTTLKITIPRK